MTRELDVCVIGFGMAGVGAVHALRNLARFTSDDVRVRLTILEAGEQIGGKAAPDNLGAQFLDKDALYPFDRILDDLDVKMHPAREDYELVRVKLGNKTRIEAETFGKALVALREEMTALLAADDIAFADLDGRSVQEILHDMRVGGRLSQDGADAMRQRMLLEDGTVKLSALAYALSLAKTPSPMRRVEVRGGLYRVVSRERDAALEDGAELVLRARVERIEASATSVRVHLRALDVDTGEVRRDVRDFDAAVLAVSPEHLHGIAVAGAVPAALPLLSSLTPARITKSNLVLDGAPRIEEHATERYAMWFTTTRKKRPETTATFFHGWEGQAPLSMMQMLKAALGKPNLGRLLRDSSRTWDASVVGPDEIPMGYISEPRAGQCVPLLQASRAHYFTRASASPAEHASAHPRSALKLASHALAIGGGVREAALCGEWAVVALLRDAGCDVEPALARIDDPQRELYGAPAALLARKLA